MTATAAGVRAILLQSGNSVHALTSLYAVARGRNPKLSLAAVCRKAGMPSTGNLADVLKGRRILPAKYARGVASALGLDDDEGAYFQLLVEQDRAGPDDVGARGAIKTKLTRLARRLAVAHVSAGDDASVLLFAIEVFAAFGLFSNRATRDQLVDRFGRSRCVDVERALGWLLGQGLIARAVDGKTFEVRVSQFTVRPPEGEEKSARGLEPRDLVCEALRQSVTACRTWFADEHRAHFETAVLSVRRATWHATMTEFKKEFLDLLGRMEESPADDLARVCVALYPTSNADRE